MYFRNVFTIAISCAIIFVWPAFCSAITNPSFESNGNIDLYNSDATGWDDNLEGAYYFSGDIWNTNWHTDGSYGASIGSTTSDIYYAGDYAFLRQAVNLTGASSILFDAKLSVNDPLGFAPDWNSFLSAVFYLDSQIQWMKQTKGTYLNQSIDVTGLTGSHTIEFDLLAVTSGYNSLSTSWFSFDNVRLEIVPEPSSITMLMIGAVSYLLMRRKQLKAK